ncbi:MAG TPA: NAD-binding protein, partial [Miltoncostaeaceae bacterium]|nr:NAD-binding protein [Miltoncostaeaceae bacterium]
NILAAGSPALIDRVEPLFDVIGSRTWRMGEAPEQANVVKIIGNYLIVCAIQSLGEAVSLGESAGVDPGALVELLNATMFPGQVYGGYGALIAERRYRPAGFSATLGRKDLGLALDVARAGGVRLPIGEIARAALDDLITRGHGDDGWAAIAEAKRPGPPGGA